ncbi:uncharacterized protein BDZ83DRAFT_117018 [Colletotrichum acutatum]|uniref:Uncharacterized protein n=1 Tax=Glomerella acutata TaxID=27357 RepID=A0AAD8UQB0_GLOAC|nr:uncharacterized protein BDZ83DRAFT_117018 [Colletotrichum acutatum]KAK1728657.1 hypothetical protein BDZ83DRAFT_117018 [Colletotrichum acutatum]
MANNYSRTITILTTTPAVHSRRSQNGYSAFQHGHPVSTLLSFARSSLAETPCPGPYNGMHDGKLANTQPRGCLCCFFYLIHGQYTLFCIDCPSIYAIRRFGRTQGGWQAVSSKRRVTPRLRSIRTVPHCHCDECHLTAPSLSIARTSQGTNGPTYRPPAPLHQPPETTPRDASTNAPGSDGRSWPTRPKKGLSQI